jgi:hypothetical protein
VCEVPVEGSGVFLHIVSDSTQQSLSGITVHAEPFATSPCTSRLQSSTYTTNATGWVSIDVTNLTANYYFDTFLEYAGQDHTFVLPQGPLDITNATLRLTSGSLSISLCYTMATSNPCRAYTQSTTTGTSSQNTYTVTTTITST